MYAIRSYYDFFDVFAVHPIQPEHLIKPFGGGFCGRIEAGGIVAAGFGFPGPAGSDPDIFVRYPDLDGVESSLVVGPDRREDDVAVVLVGGLDAQNRFGGDHGRADIKAGPGATGNPVGFQSDSYNFV